MSYTTTQIDRMHDEDNAQRDTCPTCRNEDGSLNTDYLAANGSCVFGCGTVIDSAATGMCPHCLDHSANEVECETCPQRYADWDGKWAIAP